MEALRHHSRWSCASLAADGTVPDASRWKVQVTPDGGTVVASALSPHAERLPELGAAGCVKTEAT